MTLDAPATIPTDAERLRDYNAEVMRLLASMDRVGPKPAPAKPEMATETEAPAAPSQVCWR